MDPFDMPFALAAAQSANTKLMLYRRLDGISRHQWIIKDF